MLDKEYHELKAQFLKLRNRFYNSYDEDVNLLYAQIATLNLKLSNIFLSDDNYKNKNLKNLLDHVDFLCDKIYEEIVYKK